MLIITWENEVIKIKIEGKKNIRNMRSINYIMYLHRYVYM